VDALIDGLARVRLDGRIGFIDRNGQFVIAPVFDEASAFAPGFARRCGKAGARA
jgi:WG repeat protein